jgi:hypothetical protein
MAWRTALIAVALGFVPALLSGQQIRMGPTFGASLLERRDTSLSHGPLRDEITVGRTLLAGGTLDVRFTGHDHLTVEFAIGPYHNDVERSCIERAGLGPCELVPFRSVSRAILYGMQYLRTFGGGVWRPYVSGGAGVKAYSYRETFDDRGNVSRAALSGSFGSQREGRYPFRVEVRTIVVPDNPLLLGKTQFELQARATILFPVTN